MKYGAKCDWPRKHLPIQRGCAMCGVIVTSGSGLLRFCSSNCRVNYKNLLADAA